MRIAASEVSDIEHHRTTTSCDIAPATFSILLAAAAATTADQRRAAPDVSRVEESVVVRAA